MQAMLVSLVALCLLALCVDLCLSCLGKRFMLTYPVNKLYKFTGMVTLYTYHEKVTIRRRDTKTTMSPFANEPEKINISLTRFRKVHLRLNFNTSLFDHYSYVQHVVYLEAEQDFGVSFMLLSPKHSVATMTIIPIEYHGTVYYPYFLSQNQIYMALMEKDKKKLSSNIQISFYSMDKTFRTLNAPLESVLFPYECDNNEVYAPYGNESVSTAVGFQVVVQGGTLCIIVGNCKVQDQRISDSTNCSIMIPDDLLDMPLAVQFAAKEFIAFKGIRNEPNRSYISVMGLEDLTYVKVYHHNSLTDYAQIIVNTGETEKLFLADQYQLITSTKAIQVYLLFTSSCTEIDVGGPSMTSLIPNVLFQNRYIWSLPYDLKHTEFNYLVLIIKAKQDYGFIYNGETNVTDKWYWKPVSGTEHWLVSEVELKDFPEVFTCSSSTNRAFGLYLYGVDIAIAYLHFVDFMSAATYFPLNPCFKTKMVVGDLVDNDCDGLPDEEPSKSSDDDKDGKIGEDVRSPVPEFFNYELARPQKETLKHVVGNGKRSEVARLPVTETSTNGTVFMFAMPGYLGDKKVVALNVVTFDTKNKMNVSQIVDSEVKVQKIHSLNLEHYYVQLEAKYFVPKEPNPTIYIETISPVHIFLWLERDPSTTALVKLLPVSAWGKLYYAVTLTTMPTILITSGANQNQVFVTVKVGLPKLVSVTYNHFVFKDNRKVIFNIGRLESFSISQCNAEDSGFEVGSMTGTQISALKILGVITGNCQAFTRSYVCNSHKTTLSKKTDLSLDSPYPSDFYGTEFITFLTTGLATSERLSSSPNGEITVVADEPNTEVTISSDGSYKATLQFAGDFIVVLNTKPQSIKTSKPATAAFTMWYRCSGPVNDQGMPSMTFLIPTELYYNFYTMRKIGESNSTDLQFILIYNNDGAVFITEENREMLPKRKQEIVGKPEWEVGFLPVNSEISTLHLRSWNRFGCYILYLSNTFGSITFADFLLRSINGPTTIKTTTTTTVKPEVCVKDSNVSADDQKDNDCDGKVDEEIFDNLDNDNDGLIDEDIFIRNGFYLNWQHWQCSQNCSETSLFRYRVCYHPDINTRPVCEGVSFEHQVSLCFYNRSCPSGCPDFSWGFDCTLDCSKCQKPCNKFTGACDRCRPGYRHQELGCRLPCDIGTFGQDCLGNCIKKCGGRDCLERVEGTCPKYKYSLLIMLTVVLLLPCFSLILKGTYKEDEIDPDDHPHFDDHGAPNDEFQSVPSNGTHSNAKRELKNAYINSMKNVKNNLVKGALKEDVGSGPRRHLKSVPRRDSTIGATKIHLKTVPKKKIEEHPKN